MQFLSLATISALLAAVTQAAPVADPAVNQLDARNSVNNCADSSFENQSSSGSPRVSDCQQLARNIAGGGTWTVGAGGEHRQLAQYGTCAFGAQGLPGGSINVAYIGNQDIIDLINDSINKFQWNGLVGSKGEMVCKAATGAFGGTKMIWGIYHT